MDKFVWIISLVVGAFLGFLVNYGLNLLSRRIERREAAAALRFEVHANLIWVNDIIDSLVLLRDEAWVHLKNKGYISYLPYPIPLKVTIVYEKTHYLNRLIEKLRDHDNNNELLKTDEERRRNVAGRIRDELTSLMPDLIRDIDSEYPDFRDRFPLREGGS